MYYINDERLTKDAFPEQWAYYQKGMQEIKDKTHLSGGEKNYVFFDDSKIEFGNDGTQIPRKHIDFKLQASYDGARWNLCYSSTKDRDGKTRYNPTHSKFHKEETLNPDKEYDREKIFFYLYLKPDARHRLKLRQPEEDAKKLNTAESEELDVRYMIMSSNSPISIKQSGTDKILRYIAASYGVQNSEKLTPERLKRELLSAVIDSNKKYEETKRGFKEFIQEVKDLASIKVRADIQIATERDLIDYKDTKWIDKRTNRVICAVPASMVNNPTLCLVNKLVLNPKEKENFDELIQNNNIDFGLDLNEETKEPVKEYENLNRQEFDVPKEYRSLTRNDVVTMHVGTKKKVAKDLGGQFSRDTNMSIITEYILEKLNL